MNIILSIFLTVLSIFLTKVFCVFAKNTQLMDKPNERSLHVIPTVRGGGLVFISLFLVSIPLLGYFNDVGFKEQIVLFFGTFLIALISFCDDLYNLPAKPRFAVQCIVAALASTVMGPQELDFIFFTLTNKFLIIALLFFTTLWAINHFNFMDGLDGFCGSQALFLAFSYVLLFGLGNALFYQNLCFILMFGLIGFLAFNFPPAKLFMGDVGSATLGFIIFYMAIIAQQKCHTPILYWFILNGIFLFDATITLIRRILRKEKWFAAHRKHAYQRLKQYGLNTRVILVGQLVINLTFLMGVLVFQKSMMSLNSLLILLFSILIVVYSLTEKLYPMFHSTELKH